MPNEISSLWTVTKGVLISSLALKIIYVIVLEASLVFLVCNYYRAILDLFKDRFY